MNELNSLITKDYVFFLGRINFTSDDGSQNTFVCQPTLDDLELKKDKSAHYVLRWKSNEYSILNLSHYILLLYIA